MSYQVLARKWRPQRFADVVGQQHVLSALENGLRENRLHHAYLFSGTRGVGKTSIARLFAKGLNCETGITAEPCGQCANCKAIEEGHFIDLIEIDAASRTKVEDTRELLDNVQYKPTVGRFKVYLIDEVHMLSRHSFNALLKTLEEPPEYVKFLLATTDPQKLPITILSRCLQFHLRALSPQQIQDHLEYVLNQEQIAYELPALAKLAKAAQGSIRDALSLTDQAIATGNAHITLEVVSQMLGLIDDHQPLELVQAIANADGEKAMQVIQHVAQKGVDWQQLLNDIAETLHQIAMLQLLPHDHEQETTLHFLARQMPPEDVQFFYQLMLTGKKELPLAPEQRSGVEMTVLRALAFHPKHITSQPESMPVPTPVQSALQPSGLSRMREALEQQRKAMPPQMPAQAVSSATNNANNPVQSTACQTTHTTDTASVSPALQALQARNALKSKSQDNEKKKSELATPIVPKSAVPKGKTTLSQSFAELTTTRDKVYQQQTKSPIQPVQQAQPMNDEDYRWTWLNPELESQQQENIKPSEIKQAILQERTPELVRKTIELACEQDEWSRIANELKLGGFSRQLALNSYLAERTGNRLTLVLKPEMTHLDSEEVRYNLSDALKEQGLDYEMRIGQSSEHHTPLELRRVLFAKLTLEAKEALLADSKLALLRETFSADLDESTIRAVAE